MGENMNYKFERNMKIESIYFDSSNTFENFIRNLVNYYTNLDIHKAYIQTKYTKYNIDKLDEFFLILSNTTDYNEVCIELYNKNIIIEIKILNFERPRCRSTIFIKSNDIKLIDDTEKKLNMEFSILKNKMRFLKNIIIKIIAISLIYLFISVVTGYDIKVATYKNSLYVYNDLFFWIIIGYSLIIVYGIEYSYIPKIRLRLNKKFTLILKEQLIKNSAAIVITIIGIIISQIINYIF